MTSNNRVVSFETGKLRIKLDKDKETSPELLFTAEAKDPKTTRDDIKNEILELEEDIGKWEEISLLSDLLRGKRALGKAVTTLRAEDYAVDFSLGIPEAKENLVRGKIHYTKESDRVISVTEFKKALENSLRYSELKSAVKTFRRLWDESSGQSFHASFRVG